MAIFIAIFFVVVFLCTFLFALYLGQAWIVSRTRRSGRRQDRSDRREFCRRLREEDFREDHVAVDAWQTMVDEVESWLKDEDFGPQVGAAVFRYFSVCVCAACIRCFCWCGKTAVEV